VEAGGQHERHVAEVVRLAVEKGLQASRQGLTRV
jgi:hypothetical protein